MKKIYKLGDPLFLVEKSGDFSYRRLVILEQHVREQKVYKQA